jgi:ribosomal protein S18 acetylase RimI-like enzyme
MLSEEPMSARRFPGLKYSPLTPPDTNRVTRWQLETLFASYGGNAPGEEISFLETRFNAALTDKLQCVRMVKEGSSTVGYFWLDANHRPTIAILDFFVAPDWRGRGCGSEMLRRIVTFARRTKKIILAVAASNVEAVALYRRAEFVETSQKTSHQRKWLRFELAF